MVFGKLDRAAGALASIACLTQMKEINAIEEIQMNAKKKEAPRKCN